VDSDHWVRYVAAFLVSMAATLTLTPVAARLARRLDLLDHPGGHKHHAGPTPYLGGAAVAAGLLTIGALAAGANGELFTILVGALVLGGVGLLDDIRTVPPAVRVMVEAGAGLSLWLVGVRAGLPDLALWIDLPLTVVWTVCVVNAMNMIDNMDGLAAGVAAASSAGIAAIAAIEGDYLVASFAFAVAGASVGFLRYNLPPARIFLGDAGSMLLGFLVAALTLKLDLDVRMDLARLLTVVLLAAVPLFDLSLVVLARVSRRRPPWIAGTDHTSHRLAHAGQGSMRLAMTFAGAQIVCSLVAIAVYRAWAAVVVATSIALAVTWAAGLVVMLRLPHPSPGTVAPETEPPP
jgi:UDP-GlcNAc:undecaprenyl-phosphate/decaprenyl-phosphate GlcNAc-1-phosphate transferase